MVAGKVICALRRLRASLIGVQNVASRKVSACNLQPATCNFPAAQMAKERQNKSLARRIGGIVYRVGFIVAIAFAIGLVLNKISAHFEHDTEPAGLFRGLVQGALMPMSMPNLLFGKDVIIYSQHNTGMSYKLGYTLGTNTCGAIFFGLFFWRFSRWRAKGIAGPQDSGTPSQQDL